MLFGRIAPAGKVDGGRDRHCDVIDNVPFYLYLTLVTSNVRYVYILYGFELVVFSYNQSVRMNESIEHLKQ